MLSPADSAFITAALDVAKTTPCSLLRVTLVSDGMGGNVETWTTIATTTCRIVALKSRRYEQLEELRVQQASLWRISLPSTVTALLSDRIAALGVTYEVTSPETNPGTYAFENTYLCWLIQ